MATTITGSGITTGDVSVTAQSTDITTTGDITAVDATLSGGVYLGGTGAANYLDDYEEGTFTCSITVGGVDGTSTTGDGQARYVKVGDLVMINVQRRQTGFTSVSHVGTLSITGSLPFTADEGFAIRVSNRALSMDGDAFLKVNSGSSAIYSRSSDGSNDYNDTGNTVTVADGRSIKALEFSAVYKAQ